MTTRKTAARCPPGVRERAVRLAPEGGGGHPARWAAANSTAAKTGCTTEAPRGWVRRAERDGRRRPGATSAERERENRELRRANEVLRKAPACSARAGLDRRSKP